ncbi:MAG: Oligoendopeptidase, M3 family [Candidatus Moranbacteria bacterium GW2011_GWE1_35_17]|nr:MAG: Oligoendopeptidase, M3 family [Candidatus Moranbacteria bacterium GW2011_GWE1_35_17]KKP72854.1 MAG: Oligoendopeptidase, M3 family [Candidatus Moranbacteria bacterium GW2011_GWE2_35_164]KKP84075.1 MAG: Oligoendopeptidase, M3 family [Candidatus Moranbacteria bacterium GW2011_GWF1_35_5]KKP85115.1 MAG: Oligoendopeptidase, M3 family [Candidatus Moranbacteria bacterium GW2011_GWF2_35_54]
MKNNNKKQLKRKYFSGDFEITNWKNLQIELEKLLSYKIDSKEDLINFWETVSELDKIVGDKGAWLYINMTRFSNNTEYRDAFNLFISEIAANSELYSFKLKKKFYDSQFSRELSSEYVHLKKIIANEIELFREENTPLFVAEQKLFVKYREIVSKMTAIYEGEEKTIQQLSLYLENNNRHVRQEAWQLMLGCYKKEQIRLDNLFDELKSIRVQIAQNAGFKNYRDYAHQAKGRFSYTPEDLLKFHETVEKVVVPLVEEFKKERKDKLGLEILKPWDMKVNVEGEFPNPFETHQDLIAKGIKTISQVDSLFGEELENMQKNGFIDAQNRKAKAPGGYCYPLFEQGSSFIFMNAVGIERDVTTFIHESGHAMHNMMSKEQAISQYLDMPMEVAELASMGMELISIDHWDNFYKSGMSEIIIKKELIDKINFLPWEVAVDAFQHWIYLNPNHTAKERGEYFASLLDRFKIDGDWTDLEKEKAMRWMMQLHIFQLPFYYIEYAIAQLGAIAIYRNYRQNPQKAVEQYKNFLALGYTKPVSEVYKAAGIKFDFSQKYIAELMEFVKGELR